MLSYQNRLKVQRMSVVGYNECLEIGGGLSIGETRWLSRNFVLVGERFSLL